MIYYSVLIRRGANLNIEDHTGKRADDLCHLEECAAFIRNWREKRVTKLIDVTKSVSHFIHKLLRHQFERLFKKNA